ncbi:MAG: hypothetical protein U5L09_15770 [Bacteroidales bacterium]|nr:hypothetical protein [Bacteroidales bacterium]
MWAYPVIDLSDYSSLVVRMESEEPVENLKIAMQDADGIAGEDGAGYTYVDVTKDWETLILPWMILKPNPGQTIFLIYRNFKKSISFRKPKRCRLRQVKSG